MSEHDVEALTDMAQSAFGAWWNDPDDVTDFGEHMTAAVLASDWLAARDAASRAEALREAADRWTQGAWSDVMLPKPPPPAVPVIAYSNRVGDWLRERAEGGAAAAPTRGNGAGGKTT